MAFVLVFFLILLAAITLIGHGLWVLAAAIIRRLVGSSNEPVNLHSTCSGCNRNLRLEDNFCSFCGKRQAEAASETGPVRSEEPGSKPEAARIPSYEIQPTMSEPAPAFSRVEAIIQTEPVDRTQPIKTDSGKSESRRSWSDMFSAFMEESSIQWGEIIGGLLIIGCSIALAISFRSQIAAVPLLKYSVFTGVTAGLFGLGFYSAHRWKLPTTSQGVLIISTLLTPLNFLAMTALTKDGMPETALLLGVEVVALGLFCFFVHQAARVVAPKLEWILAVAVIGPSLAMLIARHWDEAGGGLERFLVLGVGPLAVYWTCVGVGLFRVPDTRPRYLIRLVILSAFSALLPLGILLAKSGIWAETLRQFAPLISVFGFPAVVCGLEIRRRSKDEQSSEIVIAAAGVGIIGALIMLSGLIYAWPNPITLIIAALINSLACFAIAWRYKIKPAHPVALAHFGFAYLIIGNLWLGKIYYWQEDGGRLFAAFFSVLSGQSLLLLFLLVAAAAEIWERSGRRIEARIYGAAAGSIALLSLALVSAHGFGRWKDPHHAALVYLLYAVAWLVIAWRKESVLAGWIGLVLALLSAVQAMAFKFGPVLAEHHPVRLSLLLYATVAAIVALILQRGEEKSRRLLTSPLTWLALICSAAVTPFILFGGWMTMGEISLRLFWLAILWLTIACVNRWVRLLTVFQIALTLSLIFGVAEIVDRQVMLLFPMFLNPLVWQAEAVALSLFGLAWLFLNWKWAESLDPQASGARQTNKKFFGNWLTVEGTKILVWLIGSSIGLIAFDFALRWLHGAPDTYDDRNTIILSWLALAALGSLLIACLWDSREKSVWPALYLLVLLAAGKAMMLAEPASHTKLTLSAIVLSAFTLAASLLWRRRESINKFLAQYGAYNKLSSDGFVGPTLASEFALTISTALLVTLILSFSSSSPIQKVIAATACFTLPLSIALFAQGPRRQRLITTSLRLALIVIILCGWGSLALIGQLQMINRLMIVMLCGVAGLFLCQGFMAAEAASDNVNNKDRDKDKVEKDWLNGLYQEVDEFAVCGLGALAMLLGLELVGFVFGDPSPLSWSVVVILLVVLLMLVVSSLGSALLPGRDVLGVSQKTIYVYAAEAFLGLALLHTRVAMPWLFGGRFYPYWPLFVMALAFGGVGLAELFRRRGRLVLAEPLERTGIFLPLLPVIGFWAGNAQVSYTGLLLVVGLFYGVLSVTRRSFLFGLLAALAVNGGLWRYLDGVEGLGLTEHPQLWLIPAALSVLAAAKINQERLSVDQMTTIRYATLITIYVSSTADIFINGVSESPWLPIILALLSVGGVMTGLMLRIRAFLFLGTAFLMLSVLTIIWEASVNLNWTWLWYVSGIAFGVLIIYTFAIFERRRQEVLALVEKLKQWQA